MEKDKFLSADMVSAEIDKLNTRKNTIAETIVEKRGVFDSSDVETRDAILGEVTALEDEADQITADIAELEELRTKFAEQEQRMSLFKNVETVKVKERKAMEHNDVLDTAEYRSAWVDYVRTGAEIPTELRAGLTTTTENVPVPTLMQGYVETAWEQYGKFSRYVTKMSVKGLFAIPLELDADGAQWHDEGSAAPTEESITLGQVLLQPKMIKKWISLTDELMAMAPEEFMKYIADELVYRVVKELDDAIINRTPTNGQGVVGIAGNTNAIATLSLLDFNAINRAVARLVTFDNLIVAMNPVTFYDNFMSLTDTTGRPIYQIATDNAGKPQYFINGQRVEFTTALPPYDNTEAGETWAIVGNFKGYRLNFPEGEMVRTLFDPYTLATEDKARMVGRLFVAGNITRLGHFVELKRIPNGVIAEKI